MDLGLPLPAFGWGGGEWGRSVVLFFPVGKI